MYLMTFSMKKVKLRPKHMLLRTKKRQWWLLGREEATRFSEGVALKTLAFQSFYMILKWLQLSIFLIKPNWGFHPLCRNTTVSLKTLAGQFYVSHKNNNYMYCNCVFQMTSSVIKVIVRLNKVKTHCLLDGACTSCGISVDLPRSWGRTKKEAVWPVQMFGVSPRPKHVTPWSPWCL